MVAMKFLTYLIPLIVLLLLFTSIAHAEAPTTKATPSTQTQLTAGSMEGYILMDGKGIPATVTVEHSSNKSITYAKVKADEYGHYTVNELPAGTYRLNITPTGCYGGWLSDKFTVTKGEICRLNVLVAYKKGNLAGNVMLENRPLADCLVSLYSPNNLKTPLYQVRTDSNGNYDLDGIVSADSIIKPLNVSTVYKIAVTGDQLSSASIMPNNYTVKSDKTTTANVRITYQKGNISGTIETASGDPVSAASVKLYLVNRTYVSPEIANTTTDVNGTYAFKKIIATPGGNMTIWPGAWWKDYRYKVVANTSNSNALSSQLLPVYPSTTNSTNFTFPDKSYKTGIIRGYLLTDTGYRISNVTVNLMGNDGKSNRVIMSTVTGPDGSYLFDPVYASDSPVKPGWWTGEYWLSYSTARVGPFKLKVNNTLVKNVTVTAQPYTVILTPERHYVRSDGQCIINARIYDRWGNPCAKDTKIDVEIANNETYEGLGTGALNSNDKVSLTLPVMGGETNITYGWANSLFTGWNVTINSYVYPKRGNSIVSNCTLTIIPPDMTYPEELPIEVETPVIPADEPLPEDTIELPEDDPIQIEPTPTEDVSPVTPTPEIDSGNIVDQIWSYVKSVFNWQ